MRPGSRGRDGDLAVLEVDVVRVDRAAARAGDAWLVQGLVDRDADVGRAVELDEREPEARLERGRPVRHGHAPRQPRRVVRVVRRRRALVEHRQRRAHEVEDRRAGAADLVPEAGRREALADGGGRAEHERGHHGEDERVEVEERERAVEDVVRAQLEVLDHQLGLAPRVAVGDHAALRAAGGAGREQQHRQVVLGLRRRARRAVAGERRPGAGPRTAAAGRRRPRRRRAPRRAARAGGRRPPARPRRRAWRRGAGPPPRSG